MVSQIFLVDLFLSVFISSIQGRTYLLVLNFIAEVSEY